MNEAAELRFTQAWMNMIISVGDIDSFTTLFFSASKEMKEMSRANALYISRSLMDKSRLGKYLTDQKAFFDTLGGPGKMAEMTAEMSWNKAKAFVRSMEIVFMHSLLDSFISEMIEVIKMVAPEAFEDRVTNRKVIFSDIKGKSKEEIILDLIDKERIDRKSLEERIELLFSLCSPDMDKELVRDYKFDMKKIRELDNKRQKIVHENSRIPFEEFEMNTDYWNRTVVFFMTMVSHKFGVKINTTVWKEELKRTAKEKENK
ncbi:MAG: hypothetical protein JSW62_01610 [Thermoplasmatales archaeon]|nr:MAG: hypothetical protein JSW62_01610 [Thermoplasmatales archaeon]